MRYCKYCETIWLYCECEGHAMSNIIRMCELPHQTIEEEEACEALMLANIPACTNCIPQRIESHPRLPVVRCANCKAHLA